LADAVEDSDASVRRADEVVVFEGVDAIKVAEGVEGLSVLGHLDEVGVCFFQGLEGEMDGVTGWVFEEDADETVVFWGAVGPLVGTVGGGADGTGFILRDKEAGSLLLEGFRKAEGDDSGCGGWEVEGLV
jgi:hypothetical protein